MIRTKKILLLSLGVFLLLLLSIFYIFKDWPVQQNCTQVLQVFDPQGTWLSRNSVDQGRIIFMRDSFTIINLIEKQTYMGVWAYSGDAYIQIKFSNVDDNLINYLETLKEESSEKYKDIEVENRSLLVKVFYDQQTCNISSPYFFIGQLEFGKANLEDWF
jgi:hypothetical protein